MFGSFGRRTAWPAEVFRVGPDSPGDFDGFGDLVYVGCNDTVPYAQVIVIEQGRLIRQYLQDEQDSSADVDIGRLPEEAKNPFGDWIEAMGWVEADEEKLERPEQGWLWIHRAA